MGIETIGASTSTTTLTAVSPNASANTKGSWATLGTSSAAAKAITVIAHGSTSTAVNYMFDIGTGATPDVVLANIPLSVFAQRDDGIPMFITLPLDIAISTDIKCRCQCSGASAADMSCAVILHDTNPFGTTAISSMDTYGAATADSGGVEIDAGSTINTKGTYGEIDASTSATMEAFWLSLCSQDFARGADHTFLLDFATGAATSEVDVISNLPITIGPDCDSPWPEIYGPFVETISSGTRISARIQSSTNSAGDRAFDIVVIGASSFSAPAGGGGVIKLPGMSLLGAG